MSKAQPSSTFNVVIKIGPQVDKQMKKLEAVAAGFFKPKYVTQCEGGSLYFVAGCGVMRCSFVGPMDVSGIKMPSVTRLESVSSVQPVQKIIPQAKIADNKIRPLISPDIADKIFEFIEAQTPFSDFEDVSAHVKAGMIEQSVTSSNPFIVANVVCRVFGKGKKIVGGDWGFVFHGNKALETLARECAVVLGQDYQTVLDRMTAASGKPSGEELCRHDFSLKSCIPK